jgi:hypothetical protein
MSSIKHVYPDNDYSPGSPSSPIEKNNFSEQPMTSLPNPSSYNQLNLFNNGNGNGNNNHLISNGNGENWDESNLETLSDWVHIGALQIETLDLVIKLYRGFIRHNVLLGLILSTASGSISITQLSSSQQFFILNVFFTVMSFSIAIFTGLIKIYQVQERLEEYIQLKQEWITFCVNITSEIQLPISQRRDALKLIKEYKGKYLDLLKMDVDIPTYIKEKALGNLYDDDKLKYMEEKINYRNLKNDVMNQCNGLEKEDSECDHHEMEETNIVCMNFANCFGKICKKKFDGRKTSLSNIILTIVMEEEKTERDKHISDLLRIKKENKNIQSENKKYQMHLPETDNTFLDV